MSRIEFVRKKVSGKKGMLIGLMIATTIILSGLSIFTMPTRGNGYSPLLVIQGYVKDQLNNTIAGATVNLTDVANGNWNVSTTNAYGYYTIIFGGPPGSGPGWNKGDKLVGFAYYNGMQGSNDTIMRNVGTMWLNFTIDTPITTKHIIGPHHSHPVYGDYYYIRLNTVFNFTATDNDGINATYVRIWYNGQWHPTPGNGKGKNHNFWVYGTDIPKNFTMGNFPWAGEGKYYIEFYSDDKNTTIQGVEYTHNQSHDVDMTPPVYDIDFGCDTVNTTYGGINYTMIKGCAPIWIHAYDTGICQSGVKWLNITGSYIGEWPGETVEPRFDIHIRDGGAGDLDGEENGEILANVSFCEDSFHELDIVITDYLGNEATYDRDIAVDYTVPTMVKTIVGPTYPGPHGNQTWLSCNSTIWLNATDGGCNGGAGVKEIGFTIWWKKNESSPSWNTTKYPEIVVPDNGAYNSTIYDNDTNKGTISVKFHFKEDGYYLLKAWATDYVGNNNTIAVKNKHYVDCTPPWINKTISKVPFLEQMKNKSSVEVQSPWNYWQEFIANWSYVDAINVSICGDFYGYGIYAEIYDSSRTILLGKTETKSFQNSYCGWLQLHFLNRVYLEHGLHYWIKLVSDQPSFYWNGTNASTNPWVGDSIVNGHINDTWDFAFKLEYYPMHPYFYPMEYSFKNGSYEHNGLNETWITSKAFFHLAYGDEGCMGGVGVESVKYRIWNNVTGWSQWMNYTTPFNISDECKHYIEINVTDHLGHSTILNQTHYVDNSPPIDVVDIPDIHGYYNYSGKQYIRAGKGIWINLTDMPECGVGLRNATFYWRYTYTNFTTPFIEEHPNSTNDVHYGFNDSVEINGTYWYVVHLDQQHYSVFINFSRECMHDIYYFYNATDWLDNTITSEIKHIRLYVDEHEPIAWADYPWHYYQGNKTEGHIRAGANFTIYAKDMPNPIPKVCIAQTEYNDKDDLQKKSDLINLHKWPNDAQVFKALCDHINATKVYLSWNASAQVTAVIHNGSYNGTNTPIGEATVNLTGINEGWVEFTFSPGIEVNENDSYYLELFVSNNSNARVKWGYAVNTSYEDGYAIMSGGVYNYTRDWAFQIISDEENPCASGAEGIYYGYYYNGDWYPNESGEGVLNISKYYNDTEIQNAFMGHYLWYVINDSSSLDNDARHGYIEANVSFNEECVHNFYYWAKDNVCHHSELYYHKFYVDDSSPEANIEMPSCYNPINDTIFYENFSTNPHWTIYNFSGNATWQWNSTLQAMVINDTDKNDNNTDSLVSPEIDCTNYDEVYLQYDLKYSQTDDFYVNVSNDGGATWNNVWHHPMEEPSPGDVVTIDISDIAAGHTIIVNFTYTSHNEKGNATLYFVKVYGYGYRGYISCNAAMHLNAFDYPVTNGKIVDQEQIFGTTPNFLENKTGLYNAQSFIPSVDKLYAVELYLQNNSAYGGTRYVNVTLYDSGLNVVGYKNITINAPNPTWVQFDFDSTLDLVPGETYWISVAAYPNQSVSWFYNTSNPYPNGVMIIENSLTTGSDWAFKTEYYGDIEAECSAGLEGIYYGYEYNGIWHPANESDNVSEHGTVFNISRYYSQDEINSEFGGHTLWYVYDNNLGITFFNECKHDLYYWAKDNVCHHSIVYHRVLYVDNSEPVITKTHPSHGYEVVNGTPYLRAGANITLYADDMPANSCSSGTWLYWRYVWNNSGNLEYYPFFYHEGFEEKPIGWSIPYPWWGTNHTAHDGNVSIGTVNTSSYLGWSWLVSNNIQLPDVPKITLTFWQRADNLSNYDASNIFGIYNESNVFIPLKFFYKDDMSNEWQRVTIDLSPYAGQSIKLAWIYENDYGDGEIWYIDDVNITGWYGVYGYDNVTQNISFNEECHHDLYYFAEDTTCHATEIHHQEYYVDGTAPETDLHVITNGYRPTPFYNAFNYTICINDSINLTTNNRGHEPCIFPYTQTYYRWVWIDENGTKHPYPDASDINAINGSTLQVSSYANEIAPYYWLPYNGTFKFPEGCVHWLYFFSKDNLSNTEKPHNVSFGVDDEPPVTTIDFEGPSYTPDPEITYIQNSTIVWLNATDLPNYPNCTTGINYTLYAIWKYNYSKPGWDLIVPWRSTNDPIPQGITIHVYYDGTSARRISIKINIRELMYHYIQEGKYDTDCGKYEIHWRSVDYNGLLEIEHDKDVIVDCTPPDSTKEFGWPNRSFYLQAELMHWISSATPIYINGSDDEVWDSGVAKVCIMYKKVDEIEYTKLCQNGSNGVFHITGEDGKYRIFHWAVDNVGHAQDYNLTKQHVYLDNSPPESRVADIIPWNRSSVPFDVTVTNITDHGPEVMGKHGVGVWKVELYYRYSMDNATWGPWILYATNTSTTLITNPDGSVEDWTISFMPPAGERNGYFQFKSIAYDRLNNVEQPPFYYGEYDAWCHVIVDHEGPQVDNCGNLFGEPHTVYLKGFEEIPAITSHTPIYVNVSDLPDEANASGIDTIYIGIEETQMPNISILTIYRNISLPYYNYTYSTVFNLSSYGLPDGENYMYHIWIYGKDRLGNEGGVCKQKFVIDDTAPSSEANATCEGDTIYVKATASDNLAGVEKVELFGRYSEDGVNWTAWVSYGYGTYNSSSGEWEWKLENMSVGYYEFYSIATDYLGNVEVKTMADTTCYIKHYMPWDVSMDGKIDIKDLMLIAGHWMETGDPGWIREDVNKDGMINIFDLIIVARHYGESYTP